MRWCLGIYHSLGRQYHLHIPLYNSHTHCVLVGVCPQQGCTVEAIEHLMQTAVGHIPLQTFSCKCCCKCPTQHGTDPPTNCAPNPMLFSSFCYNFESGTDKGHLNVLESSKCCFTVFSCILRVCGTTSCRAVAVEIAGGHANWF